MTGEELNKIAREIYPEDNEFDFERSRYSDGWVDKNEKERNAYIRGFRDGEKTPKYNESDTFPPSFGSYLVVIDEKDYGRRVAFRTFIPEESYDAMHEKLFGHKKQTGWILGENERLAYWMEIPDWC